MDPIRDVPNITLGGFNIPNIVVRQSSTSIGGVWIKRPFVRDINNLNIADNRSWLMDVPQAIPPVVPVTIRAGTPIVDMPGCVRVHKENAKNPNNKNKQLVNDDPKQNVVLCDNGMPYYQPPEYDYRELSWQTVNPNEEEVDEGVNTEEPPAPDLDTPEPPPAGGNTNEPIECPPLNARRVGDLSTNGLERIKEYKLTPDGRVCETIWEPVPTMDQYLPSIGTVSTTATIGAVAAIRPTCQTPSGPSFEGDKTCGKEDCWEDSEVEGEEGEGVISKGASIETEGSCCCCKGCSEVEGGLNLRLGISCWCGIIFPPGAVTITSAQME
tara:strand:- start:605 stop:1582 length:978 start_codon:yes stop_codon:yes gene_type:complete